jgi:hypothetical protein
MTPSRDHARDPSFLHLAIGVGTYALAMAYLESAVVVYLRQAVGVPTPSVFPVDFSRAAGSLALIELGRELATMMMIGAVGWIAGRSPLERLAWAAVIFGLWDIGYYAWLWVFSGWPTGLGTWDLLFLLPVPWAGPVWAPVTVSLGLIGFGLAVAARLRAGRSLALSRARFALLLLGGLVVVVSFTLNAGVVLSGGTPSSFAWPVFVAGMAIGVFAAADAMRPGSRGAGMSTA